MQWDMGQNVPELISESKIFLEGACPQTQQALPPY